MSRAVLCALLTLVLSTGAVAKDPVFVVTKPVADQPIVTRDPAMGYLLLRADMQTPLHLMRIASEEDQKAYDAMRAAAFAKEQKKYPSRLAEYRRSLATYEVLKKTDRHAKMPVAPIEPTEANFVFTPFGLLAAASFGPANRFAKGENGKSVYLQSITPGTYRIYGPMFVSTQGAMGSCFCMGSVKFTVRAGEVTDLGTVRSANRLAPASNLVEVDPRLKDWPARRADYRAVGKLPNYFGLQVSRIDSIIGVIRYDRDRIIDEAAERTAQSGEVDPAANNPVSATASGAMASF